MFLLADLKKIIYILSNIIVIPASLFPHFELLSNISFIVGFSFYLSHHFGYAIILLLLLILKNNANYRFSLLLKEKGPEKAKSDIECVHLYAWCTILRYFLIVIAANRLILIFN